MALFIAATNPATPMQDEFVPVPLKHGIFHLLSGSSGRQLSAYKGGTHYPPKKTDKTRPETGFHPAFGLRIEDADGGPARIRT
jgi:hypothetical protein